MASPDFETAEIRRIRERRESESLKLESVRTAGIKAVRECLREYADLERLTHAEIGRAVAKAIRQAKKVL